MDSIEHYSQREAEQHSLDYVWQAGISQGGPMTIDPKVLQNVLAKETSIPHFQSVVYPAPSQPDQILSQSRALELPYQLNTTPLGRYDGSGPGTTSEPRQIGQGVTRRVAKPTIQDAYPASTLHSNGQISQFMVNTFAPNFTSPGISTTNSQLMSDIPRTQAQSEFQGVTNMVDPTRKSEQEWESYKDLLRRLYINEDKTLSEIMEIMKRDHDFDASARMYKRRFGVWSWNKYTRRREVPSILRGMRKRTAIGKGTIPYRNGKEIDIKRYMKRAKLTEYDLMNLSDTDEIPRGVELRTPSPSNDSTTCPSVLQLRDTLLAAFQQALRGWKKNDVKLPWTAARYHQINEATVQLDDAYTFLVDNRVQDSGAMISLAFARITEAFDAKSPICILSLVFGFHRFPHAGMSDVVWRYLTNLTRERYSESHPTHVIFSSIYRLLQRHGFVVYQNFLTECLPIIVDVMIGASNLMNPFVVDSIMELAVFFGNRDKSELEKVLDSLKEAEVMAKLSNNPLERLTIRGYIIEILILIEDGTTKTSRLSFLEESLKVIEAVEHCHPVSQRINNLKTGCLANLASLHRIFCGNSPTIFNPRHELARHFMERAICDELTDFWATDPTNILWKMDLLLEWHIEAGDQVRVEDMQRRRENALQLLLKLKEGLIGDDDASIISDVDSLRPKV